MATANVPDCPECPICHDGFKEPKLLPCVHIVCRKCLLSWLEKGGDQSGCPLCRVTVLAAPLEGQGDLAQQVDALPTDLATAMEVDSQKTLTQPHVCSGCEDAEADLFCLQCSAKLCSACSNIIHKFPVSRSHVIEQLKNLSAEQLATQHQKFCDSHHEKLTELFCTGHEELICVICSSTTHRQCSELKTIGDVAPVKREEVRSLAQKLADKEAAVTAKINQLDLEMTDAQAKFKAMTAEVNAAFDDLQGCVEAQRQKLTTAIQEHENSYLAQLKSCKLDMENVQAAVTAHKNRAEQLVASAPDVALLGMLNKFKKRLDTLQCGKLPDHPKSSPGRLLLQSSTVDKAKEALAAVGELKDDTSGDHCGAYGGWNAPYPNYPGGGYPMLAMPAGYNPYNPYMQGYPGYPQQPGQPGQPPYPSAPQGYPGQFQPPPQQQGYPGYPGGMIPYPQQPQYR